MALSQNELSILDLVASDAAYRPKDAFDQDASLFSYQDSSPDPEFGFPRSLLEGISNAPSSPTAHLPLQADPGTGAETVMFTNWEYVTKFQDPNNGFGAVIYRSKYGIDGRINYIVAMQGSDGTSRQDWLQDLDLAREAWTVESPTITGFLLDGGEIGRAHV